MSITSNARTNGIDVGALAAFAERVKQDREEGDIRFAISSRWLGGTHSRAEVKSYTLGGEVHGRNFVIEADEPRELLGENVAPNPQELLLAALNACMIVGLAANAAAMGIVLEELRIETSGALDLRGFLGLDPAVNPGYDQVECRFIVRSSASREKLDELYQLVLRTSPNFANFSRAIRMAPSLEVGRQ